VTFFPTPTWGDIDAFCKVDGWHEARITDHVFWEKILPGGELLQTRRSFAQGDEIGESLFRLILRRQLQVSRDEFWGAINSGKPVDRPVDPLEDAPTYAPWVVSGLLAKGYQEEQINELEPEQAEKLLLRLWSEPVD
jgi:hypothetical protein